MKKLVKVFASLVVVLSFVGMAAQAVSADEIAPLGAAQTAPASSAIRKGDNIFVVVKETKKQTVPVYNKNAKKTHKTVKMGSEFTAKQVKRVHGKKIVKVSGNKWLNVKDVAQD